jgi:PAS domain S-box-containing protein
MVLLWAHVVAIPLYAVYRGNSLGHAWLELSPVLMAALLAGFGLLGRGLSAAIAAGGLMVCSGVIVHLSDGMIEAHFHFFVMIPVIALYEAWAPFALAVAYVLVHHGVMGTLNPRAVYDHPEAWERPWLFAGVHAAFFAFACTACLVNWWLHERARLAAQTQTRLLSTIVESLRDGLVVLDSEGRILLRNPAGVSLMGGVDPHAETVEPAEHYGLFHPGGAPVVGDEQLHLRALAGDRVHDVDLVVRNARVPEGRVLNFSATALPPASSDGVRDVVVVFRDVTERHRTEQALADALATEQDAVERLRELERVKSDFVSTVSHELRTPITSIIGYLEVLADGAVGDLDPAQLGLVGRVERNSHRLLSLVEDLLRLSQIESATLSIDAVPTDLRDVVSAAYDGVAWLLDPRSLDLAVDVPDHPVQLEGDPAELERMLVNLLSNAVKFTPDGGRIALRLEADDHAAMLVVTDTGMGIPEAEQDQLFTRFFRSTTATERAIQGTGLGLTIVQAIVALHGGTIEVESSVDRGTTVVVRLPRRLYPAAVVA